MRLDLEVERQILREFFRSGQDAPEKGLAVMVEQDGISRFARLHAGEPLGEGESLLVFRGRPQGRARVSSGSFFFEEGEGETYDQARYAELRVDARGEALISNLLDANRQILRPAEVP
ncbi:MAG: GDYXXLXY domain-containing protein, partial [Deltaproteobacteria bacterium]|jgi:uncharacterized membrane-anchored protein|nr:GDYXXLXY domain-containing protein [Deltaproteobacteria bacterium]